MDDEENLGSHAFYCISSSRTWNKSSAWCSTGGLIFVSPLLVQRIQQSHCQCLWRLDCLFSQQAFDPLCCSMHDHFSSQHKNMETAHYHPEGTPSYEVQSTPKTHHKIRIRFQNPNRTETNTSKVKINYLQQEIIVLVE